MLMSGHRPLIVNKKLIKKNQKIAQLYNFKAVRFHLVFIQIDYLEIFRINKWLKIKKYVNKISCMVCGSEEVNDTLNITLKKIEK